MLSSDPEPEVEPECWPELECSLDLPWELEPPCLPWASCALLLLSCPLAVVATVAVPAEAPMLSAPVAAPEPVVPAPEAGRGSAAGTRVD